MMIVSVTIGTGVSQLLEITSHQSRRFSPMVYIYVHVYNIVTNDLRIRTSRPGTCNLFQVTGQIATLQWSPVPDNVEHVNE